MADAIKNEFYNVTNDDHISIIPVADVHGGSITCNERHFEAVVKRIQDTPNMYWVGMGDYLEAINRSDPRFDPRGLAKWIGVHDLVDLGAKQRDWFLDRILPIADKCLGLLGGNHEAAMLKWYERDVFFEIVAAIKQASGRESKLALPYEGYVNLHMYRSDKRERGSRVVLNVHHGFGGGKLAGAKALNLQRWLWTHECDVAVFGHLHNLTAQKEAVEYVNGAGNIRQRERFGCYAGAFMGRADYAVRKGFFPLPFGGVEIKIHMADPHARGGIRLELS